MEENEYVLEQLVSFETAKLAKEKGFNVETYKGYLSETIVEYFDIYPSDSIRLSEKYSNSALKNNWLCTAPTQSLLQKWLREKYNIHIEIGLENYQDGYIWNYQIFRIYEDCNTSYTNDQFFDGEYDSYEKAIEIGLQEALKLIK